MGPKRFRENDRVIGALKVNRNYSGYVQQIIKDGSKESYKISWDNGIISTVTPRGINLAAVGDHIPRANNQNSVDQDQIRNKGMDSDNSRSSEISFTDDYSH